MDAAPPPPPPPVNRLDLPADMLSAVFTTLEFPDLLRCGAVCTTWLATARALLRDGFYSCPQTPRLLYAAASSSGTDAELCSLADKTTYAVPSFTGPPISDRYIVGCSHGWLVTADARSELHLLNPVTGDQISLPSVTTIEQVTPILDVDDADGSVTAYNLFFYDGNIPRKEYRTPAIYQLDELRNFIYMKAVISSDPASGDDFTVMLIHNPYMQLSFARSSDKQWNWITFHNNIRFSDCIFEDDVFYAITYHGVVHLIDVKGDFYTRRVIVQETLPMMYLIVYLARSPDHGDFMQIFRFTRSSETDPPVTRTTKISVLKLDLEDKERFVDYDLGDNAVFIGRNYTTCLSAKDYPELMPNHIYFTDDDEYSLRAFKDTPRDIGVYNYEDDSVGEVVSPQPWLKWPPPIWITPSFKRLPKHV
uniref:F-box domain-containing protein n=1 Tax=Oryza meridionalis TaxID=40149 RepID=A0A0E0DPR8_9ORYZ